MHLKSWVKEFESDIKPAVRELKFVIKKVIRDPLSLVGAVMLIFFVLIALLAPTLAPPMPNKNPYEIPYYGDPGGWYFLPVPEPPSEQHPFGLLEGYDVYYGVVWGTRIAFYISSVVLVVALVIGLFIGSVAGYYRGPIDVFMMRFTDIVFAFPKLFLILILVLILPRVWSVNMGSLRFTVAFSHIDKLIIALVLGSWPSYARLTRAEVIKVKNEDFVESAKAIGCSDFRVMVRHILPNAIYPVLIMAFLGFGEIFLYFATLSFLGLGPEMGLRQEYGPDTQIPIYADWGTIISHSRMWALQYPYTLIVPGVFISFFILAWTLLGDALSNILDPAIRRRLS